MADEVITLPFNEPRNNEGLCLSVHHATGTFSNCRDARSAAATAAAAQAERGRSEPNGHSLEAFA